MRTVPGHRTAGKAYPVSTWALAQTLSFIGLSSNPFNMIRNYLKVAFRNLLKYRFISFVNLFGLTVGLTIALLIAIFVLHERSYDRYNKNAENIYRVERTFMNVESHAINLELGAVSPPFIFLLPNDFPEIKKITAILPSGTVTVRQNDKIFNEHEIYFADGNLFSVFDVDLIKGNQKNALADPYSVVLNEETARKYFGTEDPINKILKLDNQTCKVTGIMKSLPDDAHWHPDILISFRTLNDTAVYGEANLHSNWGNNSFYVYLLLPEHYNPKNMESRFPAFLNRHMKEGNDATHKASDWTSLNLRKLTDIHLYSHKDSELETNGDIRRVYIFSAIALFILLIASINYMNLSTARSILRAREIGVRKVIGALKSKLILQFLTESVLITWIAMILSVVLVSLVIPWLNNLAGQTLSIDVLLKWKIIVILFFVPMIVGIAAGIYPALFLSSFQPAKVLKGILKTSTSGLSFRKALVVVQFSISIILIISTAVVYLQLRYMQTRTLGMNKDNIVTLNNHEGLKDSWEAFKSELLSDRNVVKVARSSRIPSGRLLDALGSQINRGDSLQPTRADIKNVRADEDFIPTYQVKILAGRNFSKSFGMDTSSFLINEAAVRVLGLKSNDEAIGKQFVYGGRRGQLVGVYQDFNFESLHQRIVPLVLYESNEPGGYNRISVKITGNNMAAMDHIEKTWKKYLPETPFEYSFLDERFASLYKTERQQQSIFSIFAGIAIFIACLGLFGLSAFTISQRLKEIGVRKVLGASVPSIVKLISRDFILLVGVAALIAFPVAWYAMYQWLQDFAYRIEIGWWIFIAAGAVALIIAFATISVQAIRAALANPVSNLRTE